MAPEHLCSTTILVADDEEIVRELVVEILGDAGFEVIEARDGLAAAELFAAHAGEIGLVLLDAVMPGLDGLQVHDRIRAIAPHVPILFSSGYGTDTFPAGFFDAPGHHLIAKPYRPRMLVEKVRALLGKPTGAPDPATHGPARD